MGLKKDKKEDLVSVITTRPSPTSLIWISIVSIILSLSIPYGIQASIIGLLVLVSGLLVYFYFKDNRSEKEPARTPTVKRVHFGSLPKPKAKPQSQPQPQPKHKPKTRKHKKKESVDTSCPTLIETIEEDNPNYNDEDNEDIDDAIYTVPQHETEIPSKDDKEETEPIIEETACELEEIENPIVVNEEANTKPKKAKKKRKKKTNQSQIAEDYDRDEIKDNDIQENYVVQEETVNDQEVKDPDIIQDMNEFSISESRSLSPIPPSHRSRSQSPSTNDLTEGHSLSIPSPPISSQSSPRKTDTPSVCSSPERSPQNKYSSYNDTLAKNSLDTPELTPYAQQTYDANFFSSPTLKKTIPQFPFQKPASPKRQTPIHDTTENIPQSFHLPLFQQEPKETTGFKLGKPKPKSKPKTHVAEPPIRNAPPLDEWNDWPMSDTKRLVETVAHSAISAQEVNSTSEFRNTYEKIGNWGQPSSDTSRNTYSNKSSWGNNEYERRPSYERKEAMPRGARGDEIHNITITPKETRTPEEGLQQMKANLYGRGQALSSYNNETFQANRPQRIQTNIKMETPDPISVSTSDNSQGPPSTNSYGTGLALPDSRPAPINNYPVGGRGGTRGRGGYQSTYQRNPNYGYKQQQHSQDWTQRIYNNNNQNQKKWQNYSQSSYTSNYQSQQPQHVGNASTRNAATYSKPQFETNQPPIEPNYTTNQREETKKTLLTWNEWHSEDGSKNLVFDDEEYLNEEEEEFEEDFDDSGSNGDKDVPLIAPVSHQPSIPQTYSNPITNPNSSPFPYYSNNYTSSIPNHYQYNLAQAGPIAKPSPSHTHQPSINPIPTHSYPTTTNTSTVPNSNQTSTLRQLFANQNIEESIPIRVKPASGYSINPEPTVDMLLQSVRPFQSNQYHRR